MTAGFGILLDTTVLIDALRGRADRRRQLAELVRGGQMLMTGAINMAEVYAGMRPEEEPQTRQFLGSLEIFPVSPAIACRAGKLKRGWAAQGVTLSLAAMLVAATALEHGLTLMTENRKDFPVDGIRFQD